MIYVMKHIFPSDQQFPFFLFDGFNTLKRTQLYSKITQLDLVNIEVEVKSTILPLFFEIKYIKQSNKRELLH